MEAIPFLHLPQTPKWILQLEVRGGVEELGVLHDSKVTGMARRAAGMCG